MADAVMFGIGASHLELGDHMLCHEYFPNTDLRMSEALRQSIVRYYDFLVAYEQLLRGTGITEAAADVTSSKSGLTINAWPPKLKGVTSYSTTIANRQVVHLFNFLQAKSLSWRDMDSEQPEPRLQTNIPLKLKATGVKRLWAATPDALAGAPQQLAFTQEGQYIAFTLPSLKYWTMIVVEK
jgi:dextranase